MDFRIADTFTDALARLPAQEQKAAKTSAFDLQLDPTSPGLQFHRIDKSKDPNFWSMRVNRDLRIIVHKTAASMLLAYVDHHDKAYAWAERRRIEAHPTTGAVQIVEVRERVEAAAPALFQPPGPPPLTLVEEPPLFARLGAAELLSVGVPEDWIKPVLTASEASFYDLAAHLPSEAAEALLEYAATGRLSAPAPAQPAADPYQHPDSRRRFHVVDNHAELQAALDAPWDKWSIFLHPSQRDAVERSYGGPARVAGSAGTGKTVVALHRAARLAREDAAARVLLTTFSRPLAQALGAKLKLLLAAEAAHAGRITVSAWDDLADELHQLAFGRRARLASEAQVRAALAEAAATVALTGFSERFLVSEFLQVIDAWQVGSADEYAETPRLGRKSRIGGRQRERLWPVFEAAREALRARGVTTRAEQFATLARHYAGQEAKPFTHLVVDEAQDLGVPELRLFATLSGGAPEALFFAGDLGQRIFQPPFSWKSLGVDVRGRSTTLKVNYRTSQQIRETADRLLPASVRDLDGREEVRRGTISVFEGPTPEVAKLPGRAAETAFAGAFLARAVADGMSAAEMAVFVRTRAELPRAREAVVAAGLRATEGDDLSPEPSVLTCTMHLAKGLEFKAVVVLACDGDILPSVDRITSASDEGDLDEIYETERQLLYVACTRARDRLAITGVTPASEYLDDLVVRS